MKIVVEQQVRIVLRTDSNYIIEMINLNIFALAFRENLFKRSFVGSKSDRLCLLPFVEFRWTPCCNARAKMGATNESEYREWSLIA